MFWKFIFDNQKSSLKGTDSLVVIKARFFVSVFLKSVFIQN